MKHTDSNALVAHLAELGAEQGRNVVVHSSLPVFGLLEGGPAALYDSLRGLIGADATIAVPAYRLTAPVDEVFKRAGSPSLSVGTFSEFLRKFPGAARSANPLHSHAFVGPLARHFINDLPRASFGPHSDFAFLVEHDFLCLMLGCNLENAGTFVFHSQACANSIPYRSWRNLSRLCVLNGEDAPRAFEFAYYARNPVPRVKPGAKPSAAWQKRAFCAGHPLPMATACRSTANPPTAFSPRFFKANRRYAFLSGRHSDVASGPALPQGGSSRPGPSGPYRRRQGLQLMASCEPW